MRKKSRLRIRGNDRGFMMLAKDVRRRWMQYGENRLFSKASYGESLCCGCLKTTKDLQIDHITPMGPRPRLPEDFSDYIYRMFNNKCQALCKKCHKKKTDVERKRRKK